MHKYVFFFFFFLVYANASESSVVEVHFYVSCRKIVISRSILTSNWESVVKKLEFRCHES